MSSPASRKWLTSGNHPFSLQPTFPNGDAVELSLKISVPSKNKAPQLCPCPRKSWPKLVLHHHQPLSGSLSQAHPTCPFSFKFIWKSIPPASLTKQRVKNGWPQLYQTRVFPRDKWSSKILPPAHTPKWVCFLSGRLPPGSLWFQCHFPEQESVQEWGL